MNIEMRLLTRDEVGQVYHEHLVKDFPADEVKPLWAIYRMMEEGGYDPFGLYVDGVMKGYALFTRQESALLIDYYAIIAEYRGQGYGSLFLKAMREHYKTLPGILFEVERPEMATSEEDRHVRERRIHFYRKNGLVDTGIRVTVFDVAFRMLYLPCCGVTDVEMVKQDLERVYRFMLPGHYYEEKVQWDPSEIPENFL